MEVDYREIAPTYDRGRSYSEEKLAFWLDVLKNHTDLRRSARVLDIGCGTSRYAIPLAQRCRCSVAAVDKSREMLDEGKKKTNSGRVQWLCADAEDLPFRHHSFDCALMSMVIHHVHRKQKAISEVHRVLAPGGSLIVRTCSHEQLKKLPDYYFFPEALKIDIARIPDIPTLRSMLSVVGFDTVNVYEIFSPALDSAKEYLTRLRNKHSSTFHLLSEEDFTEGLRRAERYFSRRKLPEAWKTEVISLVVAARATA